MSFHHRKWEGGRSDELLPQMTWGEVEAGLVELATTDLKRRMTPRLVSGIRKQACSKKPSAVMAELFCLAWLLGDEAFDPGKETRPPE
jgi:hypothetical protein